LPFRRLWPAHVLKRVDADLHALLALDAPGQERAMAETEAHLASEGWIHFLNHRVLEMNHAPELQGLNFSSFGHVDWRELWFNRAHAGERSGAHQG